MNGIGWPIILIVVKLDYFIIIQQQCSFGLLWKSALISSQKYKSTIFAVKNRLSTAHYLLSWLPQKLLRKFCRRLITSCSSREKKRKNNGRTPKRSREVVRSERSRKHPGNVLAKPREMISAWSSNSSEEQSNFPFFLMLHIFVSAYSFCLRLYPNHIFMRLDFETMIVALSQDCKKGGRDLS